MQPFTQLDGLVAPLDRANVDTDAIIPKQFLKSIKRTGFGPNLFDQWRYLDPGEPGMDHRRRALDPEFVLNQARYQGAQILLTRENFGCGSSREHAPWALLDYGFRCILAPGFADIFYNNCLKNSILPVVLKEEMIQYLFVQVAQQVGYRLQVDLPNEQVILPTGDKLAFTLDPFRKKCLIQGLDEIDLTFQQTDKIRQYEYQRKSAAPWLFSEPSE